MIEKVLTRMLIMVVNKSKPKTKIMRIDMICIVMKISLIHITIAVIPFIT